MVKIYKLQNWLILMSILLSTFMAVASALTATNLISESAITFAQLTRISLLGFLLLLTFISHKQEKLFFTISITWLMSLSLLFYPDNYEYNVVTIKHLVAIAPLAFGIYSTENYDHLYNLWLTISKYVSVALFLLVSFLIITNRIEHFTLSSDYMTFSYNILPYAIILYSDWYTEGSKSTKKSLMCFLLIMPILLIWGARGPLLCVVAHAILLAYVKFSNTGKTFALIQFLLFVSFSFLTFYIILTFLPEHLSDLGINSRMIRKYQTADDANSISSGRLDMYNKAVEIFIEQPINIRGLDANYQLYDVYIHNLFIEILYDLGSFVGFGVIFILLLFIFLSIGCSGLDKKSILTLIFLALSVTKLQVSGSYLREMYFWLWLAIIFRRFVKIPRLWNGRVKQFGLEVSN